MTYCSACNKLECVCEEQADEDEPADPLSLTGTDPLSHVKRQPPPALPGAIDALRREIVEALRELELETYVPPVFNAFAKMLADRLERKP